MVYKRGEKKKRDKTYIMHGNLVWMGWAFDSQMGYPGEGPVAANEAQRKEDRAHRGGVTRVLSNLTPGRRRRRSSSGTGWSDVGETVERPRQRQRGGSRKQYEDG